MNKPLARVLQVRSQRLMVLKTPVQSDGPSKKQLMRSMNDNLLLFWYKSLQSWCIHVHGQCTRGSTRMLTGMHQFCE